MGRKRCLQILECSIRDSGLYSCEIGDLSTSCKLEVYGKLFHFILHFFPSLLLIGNIEKMHTSGKIPLLF